MLITKVFVKVYFTLYIYLRDINIYVHGILYTLYTCIGINHMYSNSLKDFVLFMLNKHTNIFYLQLFCDFDLN